MTARTRKMLMNRIRGPAVAMGALLYLVGAQAIHLTGSPATYTLDADFDEGTLINVNHTIADQLQLDDTVTPFNFIWVASSGLGTIVKIDTTTGTVLGEYHSAPAGMQTNPSRTTVDANGNVWAGNRNEAGLVGGIPMGSVVHIGLEENGQCVDRNTNGVIDTSTGLGDVRAWTNAGNADSNGGVSTAQDECIIHYVRTAGTNVRTVAVDGNNDVWVGGLGNLVHENYDGATGLPMVGTQLPSIGCGGYGGLVDGNGVLWSSSLSNFVMRYDPGTLTNTCVNIGRTSYGLGIDNSGTIWVSNWTWNTIQTISPDGLTIGGPFATGGASNDRGVVVSPVDGNVWIANSGGSNVSRLDNTGAFVTTVTVGNTPTGLAVDAVGKIWVTNLGSDNVMRINPATNLVDLTVALKAGASPYNYSDMTGSTVTAPPDAGTWTIVHDTGIAGVEWGTVSWTSSEPGDSTLTVTAASSSDGTTFGTPETATNGGDLSVADDQYLKVTVSFNRSTNADADGNGIFDGPILFDLTITAITNEPPDCSDAVPSVDMLWPPNHKFVPVGILGVTDPDGDAVSVTVDSIFQDEPINGKGDGNTAPDGQGVGSDTAEVRAERSGNKKVPGDGRVYHIGFTADDGNDAQCTGTVTVCVPHDKSKPVGCVDGGALYDSTTM